MLSCHNSIYLQTGPVMLAGRRLTKCWCTCGHKIDIEQENNLLEQLSSNPAIMPPLFPLPSFCKQFWQFRLIPHSALFLISPAPNNRLSSKSVTSHLRAQGKTGRLSTLRSLFCLLAAKTSFKRARQVLHRRSEDVHRIIYTCDAEIRWRSS